MTVLTEAPEACLIFNGKRMIVPTETPGNLPTIQGKKMTVPTETPGNLPTFQWQDKDSSDRGTRKPAYYSMAR